jgi:hypothetical protein
MLSLCHGKVPKVVSALFATLNWGKAGLLTLKYSLEQSQGLYPRL